MQQYAVYANIVSVKSIFVVAWLSKLKTNSSSHWWAMPGCLQQAYNSTAQLLQHSQLFLTFPTCRKGVVAFPGELFVSSTCWNVFDSSTGLALYTEKCIILAWQLQNTLHDRDICTECVCVCVHDKQKEDLQLTKSNSTATFAICTSQQQMHCSYYVNVCVNFCVHTVPTHTFPVAALRLLNAASHIHTHNSAVDYTVTVV